MTGRTIGTVLLLAFPAAAEHQDTAPGPISLGKAAEAAQKLLSPEQLSPYQHLRYGRHMAAGATESR